MEKEVRINYLKSQKADVMAKLRITKLRLVGKTPSNPEFKDLYETKNECEYRAANIISELASMGVE